VIVRAPVVFVRSFWIPTNRWSAPCPVYQIESSFMYCFYNYYRQ